MDKEQKDHLEREVEFAAIGRQVLDNAAFQQALTARKAQIFEQFCRTGPQDAEIREEAWRTMQNMQALEDYFTRLLSTGKMAQTELEKFNGRQSRH